MTAPLVVVFGAAGAVGAALSTDLAADPSLRLRLVDVDTTAIAALSSERVEVVAADITATGVAERLCAGGRLLMNCLSMTFFDEIIDLAIRVGIDYADLISEPTADQADRARAAGIVAVPGLGLSPGLSNVLVAHAAREIEPISVDLSFVIYRPPAKSRGALDTLVWEIAEFCPDRVVYRDGEFVQVGPFEDSRMADFGGEFGTLEVLVRPHPEPKSLPRNFPSLRSVAVRGTWQREMVDDFAVLNRWGLLADAETSAQTKEAIWRRAGGKDAGPYRGQRASRIDIVGTRDGRTVHRTYRTSSVGDFGSYQLTGYCAAVGVRLMAAAARTQVGVVEPEAFFDPPAYLAGLEAQGIINVTWAEEPVQR